MPNNKPISAIAVFNFPNCKGTVSFTESLNDNSVMINIDLEGAKKGLHGFHIHETGNLLDGCGSCKSHFNPTNKKHGGPNDKERHVGDLGNIIFDNNKKCKMSIKDKVIKLRGNKFNILGRSCVVHSKEDDLGRGGNPDSLKTGNAGSRIGCAVIGYKDAYYF